jgi:hypothetical protein
MSEIFHIQKISKEQRESFEKAVIQGHCEYSDKESEEITELLEHCLGLQNSFSGFYRIDENNRLRRMRKSGQREGDVIRQATIILPEPRKAIESPLDLVSVVAPDGRRKRGVVVRDSFGREMRVYANGKKHHLEYCDGGF